MDVFIAPLTEREQMPGTSVSPILIFAWGNPSRGDDAIGPMIYERLHDRGIEGVSLLTDFQLQVEHVVDVACRDRVLFVDAAIGQQEAVTLQRLTEDRSNSYTTHELPPSTLLGIYIQVYGEPPPPSYLMTVAGYGFDLGEPLSGQAEDNIDAAIELIEEMVVSRSEWLDLYQCWSAHRKDLTEHPCG